MYVKSSWNKSVALESCPRLGVLLIKHNLCSWTHNPNTSSNMHQGKAILPIKSLVNITLDLSGMLSF